MYNITVNIVIIVFIDWSSNEFKSIVMPMLIYMNSWVIG